MKKYFFILLIAVTSAGSTLAQTDSINFVSAKWETKKIAKGIIWKHYWFRQNLFNANENINVLEINPKKAKLVLGYEMKVLKPVADFAKEYNAIAAINGGFFDVKNGGPVDVIKVEGIGLAVNRGGVRVEHQQGALVFDKDRLNIAKWDGTDNWESKLNGDVMVAGPILIYHDKREPLDPTASFVKTRNPRTGVAITKNRVLLITIDGRNENSTGVSLVEMANIVKWLKAKNGINLDGGGSTTLWIGNQGGVVNYPTDNKKWDHEGARKVANAVIVLKK